MNKLVGDKNTKIKKYVFIVKTVRTSLLALFAIFGFVVKQELIVDFAFIVTIIICIYSWLNKSLEKAASS